MVGTKGVYLCKTQMIHLVGSQSLQRGSSDQWSEFLTTIKPLLELTADGDHSGSLKGINDGSCTKHKLGQ
jgi:hypothetical protein